MTQILFLSCPSHCDQRLIVVIQFSNLNQKKNILLLLVELLAVIWITCILKQSIFRILTIYKDVSNVLQSFSNMRYNLGESKTQQGWVKYTTRMSQRHNKGESKTQLGWVKDTTRVNQRHNKGESKAQLGWVKGTTMVNQRHNLDESKTQLGWVKDTSRMSQRHN